MLLQHTTGFSRAGAEAALGMALSTAGQMAQDAASVVLIVESVINTGDGWVASVNVLIEPRAAPEGEAATHHARNILQPAPDFLESEEKEEHERDAIARQKQEEQYRLAQEIQQAALIAENRAPNPIFHLFIQWANAPVYRSIENRYNYDYVHVIAEGSLWEAAKERHPDLELYEAAHPSLARDLAAKARSALTYTREPTLRKTRALGEDLVDE